MDKKANDTFAFDLENRLDDFFSDEQPSQDAPAPETPQAKGNELPLKDLKSTVLSIDWEITDSALEAFIQQVEKLTKRFSTDKVILSLLKILNSLGKYVRKQKSNAHPDTIKRIMSVYSSLETVVSNATLSPAEKEQMLREEIDQFKLLKAKIVTAIPAAGAPAKPAKTIETAGLEAVLNAIVDLKTLLATELGAIRKEMAQLRKK